MVDTESFVYEIEAEDFYGNNIKDVDANLIQAVSIVWILVYVNIGSSVNVGWDRCFHICFQCEFTVFLRTS